MGLCASAPAPAAQPDQDTKGVVEAPPAPEQKRLDPKDFMFVKRENETLVKPPGSIKGQQFVIDECKNCDIFLLDHTATVTVDSCENCRVFLGPCSSSVYIRDCTDCKWVVACQQFRTRNCQNNDVMLYIAAGQPVIESSSNIRFGCFQFSYFSLRSQFAAAGLSPWNTEWCDIHDFTKNADGKLNWSFLPEDTKASDLFQVDFKTVSEHGKEEVTNGLQISEIVTPTSTARRPIRSSQRCFMAVFAPNHHVVFDILAKVQAQVLSKELYYVRSRQSALTASQRAELFEDKNIVKVAGTGDIVGIEWHGDNCVEILSKAVASAELTSSQVFCSSAANADKYLDLFFEQMKTKM